MLEELRSALYLLVVLGKLTIPEGKIIDVYLILEDAKNKDILSESEFDSIICEFDTNLRLF